MNCYNMVLEYISKIIQDTKIYQYFIDKKFIHSLNSMFNTNEHKIVAYKFIELLIKSSQNKEMNEDRIKVILNRIDIIFLLNQLVLITITFKYLKMNLKK